ncbi:MAG: hypothetical protein HC782_02765 [Gammaproteobacteria bacterium]|nr:hypothetical protein [Gammaproteobacteria bacterium]
MRILSGDDVRSAVPISAAVKAVADAFAQIANGRAEVPLRISLGQAEHDSHTFFMPALLAGGAESQPAIGMKVVSVFPHNAARHRIWMAARIQGPCDHLLEGPEGRGGLGHED